MEQFDRSEYSIDDSKDSQTRLKPVFIKSINHKTDTSGYDSLKERRITPEEAEEEWNEINDNKRFANEEFGIIVENVEKRLKREITYEEFDLLCQEYAIERAYYMAKLKAGQFVLPEEIQINPVKVRQFYQLLINNEPLETSYRKEMEAFENSMVEPIDFLVTMQKQMKPETIEVDVGSRKRINIRHKGKVNIVGADNKCKYIRIDNGEDVKLLRMKYRQEWIDRKYPDMVKDGKVIADESRADMEFE